MDRDDLIRLLESLLPYIEYAAAKGLPNALYYQELIEGMIWQRNAGEADRRQP